MKSVICTLTSFATALALSASSWAGSCNNLDVNLYADGWQIMPKQVSCDHGKVAEVDATHAIFTTIGTYGPDCTILFTKKGGSSFVRFQQNFCVTEGGNITVTYLKGMKPDYIIQEGSFNPPTDGSVAVLDFTATGGKFKLSNGKITK